ncbi:integral membrane protein GPR137B [Exaiptasia diaphana]|uniref:Uncharacterized protein n=1 Tax=Exaiptasia diaphana TaxID=2652724 RepID=A0A913WQL4_EXADI|nr:integral membrane protein GPR137B [Exaiptasia diaphana]KXJ18721.1 Integral membrane protein GPR137B [Exaiptasia diaphana]
MARSDSNGTTKNILPFSRVITEGTTIPSSVQPPLPFNVHLGFAVVFIAIYALLFFFIISQLTLILYYRHRRLSYQSFFLFTCLFWAGARTSLFSFYFHDCMTVNNLPAFPRWLLFALPIYLQFLMLTLLTLYLVKFLVKSGRTSLEPARYKRTPNVIFTISNLIFLVINVISSVFCPDQSASRGLVITRVIVNEFLFIFAGILLCLSMRKITKTSNSSFFLEGQSTTVCQATSICLIVVFLYISRAVYNMIAITVPHDLSTFGFGWINISDEGEINNHDRIQNNVRALTFVAFGVVLILWEVFPTFMIIWFFRVRRPKDVSANVLQGPSVIANSNSFDKRSYFFDNPHRYDSDEDIQTNAHNKSNYDIPGILSPSATGAHSINTTRSYGSIAGLKSGSFNRSSSSYPIPGTTPPMLFNGRQSGYQRSHLETVKDHD